jgi:MarR family transcriptional regulator, transcriptional regulator for hemolysin
MRKNLDRDFVIVLIDVARHMRTRFDQWARTYGMTRAQMIILVRLVRQPGISQNELAAICEVEPITVGRLVDRLEARGLIERRPDPTDRRIRRLHLLPASEPILAAVDDYREALEEYVTEGLDPEIQGAMLEALLHLKFKLVTEATRPKLAVGE